MKIIASGFTMLAFAFLLTHCSGSKNTAASSNNLQGTWVLTYITGSRIAFDGLYPDKKPYLSFDTQQKRINGNTSCNTINTSYTLDGNKISFQDGMSTMMACPGGGEAAFTGMLKKVNKYSMPDANTLALWIDEVEAMRFTRKTDVQAK